MAISFLQRHASNIVRQPSEPSRSLQSCRDLARVEIKIYCWPGSCVLFGISIPIGVATVGFPLSIRRAVGRWIVSLSRLVCLLSVVPDVHFARTHSCNSLSVSPFPRLGNNLKMAGPGPTKAYVSRYDPGAAYSAVYMTTAGRVRVCLEWRSHPFVARGPPARRTSPTLTATRRHGWFGKCWRAPHSPPRAPGERHSKDQAERPGGTAVDTHVQT